MPEKKNTKLDKDDILQSIYETIIESKKIKNGEFRTERALFEERTTNKLESIERLLEKYTNVIQNSVWFFKLMNWFANNKRYILLLLLVSIVIINLIQYIPLAYIWKLILKFFGIEM